MRFEHDDIDISRIDIENRHFRISTGGPREDLLKSMERSGLINAPILCPEDDRFIVVSGFKRIEAARGMGWRKIASRVLPRDVSRLQCVRIAVADNSMQRALNVMELSNALALLRTCFENTDELIEEAFLSGLAVDRKRLAQIEPLRGLPPSIREGVLSESIAVPTARRLADMPPNEAIAFAGIFLSSNCSLNKQREIILLVQEIAARDNESVADLLSRDFVRDVIDDPGADKNTKARRLRMRLRKARYPRITAAEKAFVSNAGSLGLNPKMKLVPPKDFEGGVYSFVLDFKNLDELKAHRDKLDEVLNGPDIGKIIF